MFAIRLCTENSSNHVGKRFFYGSSISHNSKTITANNCKCFIDAVRSCY
uniref:Uncharacterized protein n=1 Tax=Anguilla anguilla TaxID=7936 RepID=A0A0E9RJ80_ANGAN